MGMADIFEGKTLFFLANKARKAVFSVITYNKENQILNTGNGFYIDENGTAVSDYTLFKGAERAVVVTADGKELPVEYILGANDMYDVVKFKTAADKKTVALQPASCPGAVSETVYVLPYSTQKAASGTHGTISKIDTISNNIISTIDLGNNLGSRSIQLIALITLLSLVPGLAIMVTCFPFILTVLSILRQAIGLQQAPPNMLLVTLALFLTWYVMDPVFTEAWANGGGPFYRGEMDVEAALPGIIEPFRTFMAGRLDPDTFRELAALRPGPPKACRSCCKISLEPFAAHRFSAVSVTPVAEVR